MYFHKFAGIDMLTYSALPPDNGIGEGSWAGLSFSPYQISMVSSFSTINVGSLYTCNFHVKTCKKFLEKLYFLSFKSYVDNSLLKLQYKHSES